MGGTVRYAMVYVQAGITYVMGSPGPDRCRLVSRDPRHAVHRRRYLEILWSCEHDLDNASMTLTLNCCQFIGLVPGMHIRPSGWGEGHIMKTQVLFRSGKEAAARSSRMFTRHFADVQHALNELQLPVRQVSCFQQRLYSNTLLPQHHNLYLEADREYKLHVALGIRGATTTSM